MSGSVTPTYTYPNMLAQGVTSEASFLPFELWAGESDIVTSQGTTGATALEQFRVVALDATGLVVPWNNVATDTTAKAIGFTAQASVVGGPVPYFTGGVPNHLALVWPTAVATLNARKAAFAGSNITISSLL